MSTTTSGATVTVALLGNPNTGKSTLFNALAGVNQRVGNYPGVTVEKRVGRTEHGGRRFNLIDLPGTYSLTPRSPDEMVAVDVLLGRRSDVESPDVVVCIVNASNLPRNLYLLNQALELEKPVVVVLNMVDVARDKGIEVDIARLQRRLGVPVVETQADRRIGIDDLKQALLESLESDVPVPDDLFPKAFRHEVDELTRELEQRVGKPVPRYVALRLLLDTGGYLGSFGIDCDQGELADLLHAARRRLTAADCSVLVVETNCRYHWVEKVLDGVVTYPANAKDTLTDRIDRLLTHRVLGTLIFFAMMIIVFQSIFSWAGPLQDLIEGGVGQVSTFVAGVVPEGMLQSLLVHGVISGVGAVLVFLPQIFMLFFFLTVLEDCGYMARTAYLMDNSMSRIGLSGKSFIPLMSSFACAVPGIMSARVIEDRRDRLITVLVAPLMSCSAPANIRSVNCRLHSEPAICSRLGRTTRADVICSLLFRDCCGHHGCQGVKADDVARRDASFCDGTARLPLAIAENGAAASAGSWMGVCPRSRHFDPCRRGDCLGGSLLSSQRRA